MVIPVMRPQRPVKDYDGGFVLVGEDVLSVRPFERRGE